MNMGKIIVKLDRHEARKTNAYTRWKLPSDAELLDSTFDCKKTHWEEYWLVDEDSEILMIRNSNRGNIRIQKFKAKELEVSKDINEVLEAKKCLNLSIPSIGFPTISKRMMEGEI